MTANAMFWDKIADKYYRDPISNMDAYEAGLARVRHWLRPDMRVLEIGCGTGMTALKLADMVQDYVGTDISKEMVRLARQRAEEAGAGNVQFHPADSEGAGQGGQFDAVLGFNILHLVNDVESTLRHARSLLQPGGLFITKTPCLGRKFYFRPMIGAMQLIGKAPKPVHLLHAPRLASMIETAGFEIVEQGGYPPRLPNQLIVARAV